LELIATLSVALVAVPVGLRLLAGALTLPVGLFVVLLAPEAYAPLRVAAARFHASQEGLLATEQALALLTGVPAARPAAGRHTSAVARVPGAGAEIVFERVRIAYGDRVVLREVSCTVPGGATVGLIGPSGAGKTSLLAVLLGFVTPASGRVLVGGAD